MSHTNIPDKVKQLLMAQAGGRCEYRGCPRLLTEEFLTKRQGKYGVFAHIIADRPGGPRGSVADSARLAKCISNLILLCHDHHRLIDVEDVTGHSVALLREHKLEHEARIKHLTSIQGEFRTLIVLFRANIGPRKGLVSEGEMLTAVLPRYPLSEVVDIDLARLAVPDGSDAYWVVARTEVAARGAMVQDQLIRHDLDHASIFAIGPIPLLMDLGRVLGDIAYGEPRQKRRSPPGWTWSSAPPTDLGFHLVPPPSSSTANSHVGLVLSISDDVDKQLVSTYAGGQQPLFEVRVSRPMTDIVSSPEHVRAFRSVVREGLTMIRQRHGAEVTVHVYPAVPNSLGVAFGQALLPKTDPKIIVHELNRNEGGWREAFVLLQRLTA